MIFDLIMGLITFVLVSLFLSLFYLGKISDKKTKKKKGRKKKNNKEKEIVELRYLSITHNLKIEKLKTKKILIIISIIDAFIISSVFVVVQLLPWDVMWKLMVGFVLLMGLIYSIYSILGTILAKKGFGE